MYYHSFYTVDPFRPKSVQFDVWSSQEIRKLSMAKIQSVILFDALGYPVPGGLYDTRLGPLSFNSDPCATCGHNMKKCVGHYGHIDLPLTVFNPLFMTVVTNILKASCRKCHKFMISEAEKSIYIAQFKLVDAGYLNEAHALDSYLEENMYKMPSQIREEMEKFCRDTIVNPSPNLCKYADDRWRYYESRLLRQGAVVKVCFHCKAKVTKVKKSGFRLYEEGKINVYLTPMAVRDHFRQVWKNEMPLLKTLFKVMTRSDELYPTDLCFIDCILVTPSNTRPVNIVNKKLVEHPKTVMYKGILFDCQNLLSIMQVMNDKENAGKEINDIVEACQGGTINEKLDRAWNSLQVHVNALLDANALKALVNTSVGVAKVGLKQLIEKKAGILRKNMMGKRVDYFARSVVTPDPMLHINEVGVPIEFAKKLTYPVPVTPWNVNELRKAVLNGPQKHPGANIVEDDGSVLWISGTSKENRKSLAKTLFTPKLDASGPKVVHRHLVDGDILLMNRQPSLHKPSIMAHKARILKGEKTFRLHYGNCKAYNADFDGDEINLHGVQSEASRAEALEIVNAAYQYLVPKDGTPLSGLIQDHVIAGFRLTSRDKFFDRLQYNKLVFNAIGSLVDDIKTLPPCIRKPKTLWSGKQVISTIIINLTPEGQVPLNLDSKTKLGFNAWLTTAGECDYMTTEERHYMSETNVVIRQGEFLSGLLDKNHVGSSHYSVVHYFYELYGGDYSANLLSAFSKLFTFYLQTDGFTLGVLDILVKKRPDAKRKKIAKKTRGVGVEVAKRALNLPADEEVDEEQLQRLMEIAYKKNTNFRGFIDSEYKATLDQVTNDINKLCLPVGLLQPFPVNNLQLMVQSGAKGSTVNTMQISCLLGQIELEGKRPPLMISGKSLPSFRPYDPSPMAGGFISSRFMTGIRPQEFFFHCMAGREGLIDTAVKTSRSGYLQRCLVKHLEGLVVHYDQTVRDTDNSVVQFYYGEDGLDILKSQLLKPSQMKFFSENTDAFVNKREMRRLKREIVSGGLKERKSLVAAHSTTKPQRDGKFLQFCREMACEKLPNMPTLKLPGRAEKAGKLCRMWQTMVDDDNKKRYGEKISRCPDPVIADFKSDIHFGAVSEVIENMIDDYIAKNEGILPIKKSKFKDIIYSKTLKSLCQPGEAVGVLAAQSVGEPSTQMTLNTFHFAGRGEMNVTLGIPRLREILMVASKRIKTPTMEIPFKTDVPELEKKAEFLRKSFTRVVLKDVLEKVTVKESLRIKGERVRVYDLEFFYLPRRGYSNSTNLKPRHILSYIDKKFTTKLYAMLKKYVKSLDGQELISGKKATKKDAGETGDRDDEKENMRHLDDDSDDDSDADGDGDASDMKRRDRRTDALEYDDDDDDEEDVSPNNTLGASKVPKSEKDSDDDDEEMAVDDDGIPQGKNSESSDDEASNQDTTLNLDKIIDSIVGPALQKKGVQVIDDYYVEEITHDPVKKMWSKIKLIVSLKYKRIDLSDVLPAFLENCVVYEVPGIKRAITYRNGDGLLTLKAEGSNGIAEFFKHDRLLDLNKLYSNDIHAVARTYGIEAANRVILKEVQEVFKVYGITVDPRHLLLIADYMTFDGSFQPLNRAGMDNCPSPLQQMTFESTLKYLKNATIHKLQDNLQSPSSCLIVGQESKIGSGLVRLFNK